uniref:Cadherin N-terminal domain-containing protein n=1 Tax=Stegastes partitus TaxID=144197 RepID=A0A3B4ZNT7_9TELE
MARRGRSAWLQRLIVLIVSLGLTFNFTSAQLRYSIPEELTVGSAVGNIAKDLGLDVGALNARGFRIASPSGPVQH